MQKALRCFTQDLTHYSCVAFTSWCPGEFLRHHVPFRASRFFSALSWQLCLRQVNYQMAQFSDHRSETLLLPPQRSQASLDLLLFFIYKGTGLLLTFSLHTLVCDVWNCVWVGVQECYLPLHTDLSEEQKALFDFCIVDRTVFFFLFFFLMTHD